MKVDTVRNRILMAFKDENTILGRRDILKAAQTSDYNEIRHAADSGLLRQDGNEYGLTPSGRERQEQLVRYREAMKLTHG